MPSFSTHCGQRTMVQRWVAIAVLWVSSCAAAYANIPLATLIEIPGVDDDFRVMHLAQFTAGKFPVGQVQQIAEQGAADVARVPDLSALGIAKAKVTVWGPDELASLGIPDASVADSLITANYDALNLDAYLRTEVDKASNVSIHTFLVTAALVEPFSLGQATFAVLTPSLVVLTVFALLFMLLFGFALVPALGLFALSLVVFMALLVLLTFILTG